MATKECKNGHVYDPGVYGDKCPFCPSEGGHTVSNEDRETIPYEVGGETVGVVGTMPTVPVEDNEGRTIIRKIGENGTSPTGGREIAGMLIEYKDGAAIEIHKVYPGVTTVGRNAGNSIRFATDKTMSGEQFKIQYVAAKGDFKLQDLGSSNGTFVNGNVYVMGDVVNLKSGDSIVAGETRLVFVQTPVSSR